MSWQALSTADLAGAVEAYRAPSRPGVSATELPTASGVERMVLYALVTRLDQSSETATERLPGKATGYRLNAAR
jgi:hypothetical protein